MASSMAGRAGGGNPCRSLPGLPTRTVCHPSLGREGGRFEPVARSHSWLTPSISPLVCSPAGCAARHACADPAHHGPTDSARPLNPRGARRRSRVCTSRHRGSLPRTCRPLCASRLGARATHAGRAGTTTPATQRRKLPRVWWGVRALKAACRARRDRPRPPNATD